MTSTRTSFADALKASFSEEKFELFKLTRALAFRHTASPKEIEGQEQLNCDSRDRDDDAFALHSTLLILSRQKVRNEVCNDLRKQDRHNYHNS